MRVFHTDDAGDGNPALYVVREAVGSGSALVLRPWPRLEWAQRPPADAVELLPVHAGCPRPAEPEQPESAGELVLTEAEARLLATPALPVLRRALEAELGDQPRYTRAAIRRALDAVLGPLHGEPEGGSRV